MNSSTGFKKRSLLRPPSGLLSNTREFLKVVDISQSVPIIVSNIRTEVAVIQQTINVLDKDKRIRTGESSLEKSYVLNLRKWLRDVDQGLEKEDDDGKILKQMGVDSYETGFQKLWKILSTLDLVISKMTELQIVQLLKYDQMYGGIAEDSSNGQRILQAIGKGGFNPSTFLISQVALQREIQLFQAISELKRGQGRTNIMSSSKGMSLNSKVRDDTSQLIEQLRTENKKLTSLLQELQLEKQRPVPIVQQVQKQEGPRQSGSAKDVFIELQSKYSEEIDDLNKKIARLNQQLADSKANISLLETRSRAAEDQLKTGEFVPRNVAAGTYEQALLEQMNKMKKGFENRIQRILQDFAVKEKQSRKRQYQFKTQNEKVKWEKGLLLKKFEALSAN